MARIFVYDGREFPDPDENRSVDEIKRMMTDFFPELANAEVREHIRGSDTLHEFVRKVGTKGAEKLVCDRCGQTYTDEESIESAKRLAEKWAEMCRADGVEPRGISPCPVFPCEGELILKVEE
jgi:PRTRC genetic system protein C